MLSSSGLQGSALLQTSLDFQLFRLAHATPCVSKAISSLPVRIRHNNEVLFLQSHLMAAVEDFINSGAEPAERMIHNTVECELAYINTDHPQFLGGSRAISIVMERRSRMPDDSSEDDQRTGYSMAGDLAIARHSKSASTHPRGMR